MTQSLHESYLNLLLLLLLISLRVKAPRLVLPIMAPYVAVLTASIVFFFTQLTGVLLQTEFFLSPPGE